jgi:hypothetical protein
MADTSPACRRREIREGVTSGLLATTGGRVALQRRRVSRARWRLPPAPHVCHAVHELPHLESKVSVVSPAYPALWYMKSAPSSPRREHKVDALLNAELIELIPHLQPHVPIGLGWGSDRIFGGNPVGVYCFPGIQIALSVMLVPLRALQRDEALDFITGWLRHRLPSVDCRD